MGKEVGTSRQNIENIEAAGDRQPRYIKKLAQVMGTTVDALLAGCATVVWLILEKIHQISLQHP